MPQFYLHRFADHNQRLRVLDKQTGSIVGPTHIRNVAVEKDFHTITTEDGPSDEFELIVAGLEAKYATGFSGLDKRFPPDDETRAYVAMFAAFQFVRSSTWRDISLKHQGDMMKRISQMMARDGMSNEIARRWFHANVRDEMSEDELDDLLSWASDGKYEIVVNGQQHVLEMLSSVQDGEVATLLLNRSWSLLHTRFPHEFITSEHPVAVWSPRPEFLGLETAHEVTVPLDRNRLLLMDLEPANQGKRRRVTPQMVEHLNARTRNAARRWVFAHPLTRENVLRGE